MFLIKLRQGINYITITTVGNILGFEESFLNGEFLCKTTVYNKKGVKLIMLPKQYKGMIRYLNSYLKVVTDENKPYKTVVFENMIFDKTINISEEVPF